MTLFQVIVVLLVAALLVPIVTYLAVKLGTYAFFRGRELFFKRTHDEQEMNCDNETRAS